MGLDRTVMKVATVVVLGAIMSIFDLTIVNVALAAMLVNVVYQRRREVRA